MSFKKFFIITFIAVSFIAMPATAFADYTDYIPGVGVIKVKWGGTDSNGNPIFNIEDSKGNSIASNISGEINKDGRGVPSSSALADISERRINEIQPPSNRQIGASVLDSSERRDIQFREAHPEVSANQLLIGYPSNTGKPILAPDNNTTAREATTIALRTAGVAQGNDAWDMTAGLDDSGDLDAGTVNAILDQYNTGLRVVDENGDGIIQRGEVFNSIPANPSRSEVPAPKPQPSDPTPSNPSAITPSCSFSSLRKNILVNQGTSLVWSCSNANSCFIDQGIGNVPTFGEKEILPEITTTYTLTCQNSEATRSYSTVVNVFEVSIEEISPL
ncbi:MAG: hypothetical protein PHS16_02855 [Candidatus Colwellbacteria bacterium]|nr:hypothetical protein [Candidatus Colwellbacteria bacterium]MCK9497669.1 hypothetical protein [Candidatus Colwellbacteria bacterium]MDD3752843.1 hypothetical protein [Candidatus Colwellbacteria bacterium]